MRCVFATFFWLSLLLASHAVMAGKNLADFDFVTQKVADNYAGWPSKTRPPRDIELQSLTASLRAQVREDDDSTLRLALRQWLDWFDDRHLTLQWTTAAQTPVWPPDRVLTTAKQARKQLLALGKQKLPLEGFWTIDDDYVLAVLRRDPHGHQLQAIVLRSKNPNWQLGDVKAIFNRTTDGSYSLRYGTSDRSELHPSFKLQSRDEILEVEGLGFWRRGQNTKKKAQQALSRWPEDRFFIKSLDYQTLYCRLPSFNKNEVERLKELITTHARALSSSKYLIIDLRGNGGGSDFVYEPVLPWLYTQPFWRLGVELRVSKDNARLRSEVSDSLVGVSAVGAMVLREESERLKTATTAFIARNPAFQVIRLDALPAQPSKVVILLDRAASSAENFLLDARQSRTVVLMGQAPSEGAIDFGEMMGEMSPSGRFQLLWATTRSLRLPNDPLDQTGIKPDVLIPAEVDDPVAWVLSWLRVQPTLLRR